MVTAKVDSSLADTPQARPARDGARLRQACIDAVGGDELLFLDGHDDAILGMAERDGEACVVYDRGKVIQALRRRDGMDKDGAAEFFEYNIAGSWFGPATPVFVRSMSKPRPSA